MKKEIWKDIPNYVGLYQASNTGKIRSLDRIIKHTNGKTQQRRGVVLKQRENEKGYKMVHLSKDNVLKNKFVHVLVLEAFLERPYGMTQINHKDENKGNNNLSNLEYCDASYNQNYGSCGKNKSMATINDVKKSKKVIQLTKDGSYLNTFPSLREVERTLGFMHGHIREACNGKLHTAYGYKWKWSKDYYDASNGRFASECLGEYKTKSRNTIKQLSLF